MRSPSAGADQTSVEQVPEPVPGAGEISIEVHHAGLNYLDVMARRGDPGYANAWPYVPGLEVSGIVCAVADPTLGFAPGDRVAAFSRGGGLAEVAVVDSRLAVKVPENVPTSLAAAAPLVLTTAMLLLTDIGRVQEGESVLMHSVTGGIGSAVARLAPLLFPSGRLVGTVGRSDKVEVARSDGWDSVYARDDAIGEALRHHAGEIDVILDPLGTSMIDLDLLVAAPGARIVLFGNPAGGQLGPLPPTGRLFAGNMSIGGFSISGLSVTAPHRIGRALARVVKLLGDESLAFPVTELSSLDDVASTHQMLAEARGVGKYVVAVRH